MNQDSTGRPIRVGDKVRYRGEVYTIKSFGTRQTPDMPVPINFEETSDQGDEWGVDLDT